MAPLRLRGSVRADADSATLPSRWRVAVALLLVVGFARTAPCASEVSVGTPAPDFTLLDTTGRPWSRSSVAGSYVVLEWFNASCPFVQKHYRSGSLQRLQNTYTARGVKWLTVVSSAPGKPGHLLPEEADAVMAQLGSHQSAMALDPEGTLGRRFGAKTTPYLCILDPAGIVIYAGAIDDRPSTDPADLDGATNYVQRALDEALAGQPVSVSSTTSYGCSVKY